MAVNEQRGSGKKPRVHAHTFPGVGLDHDKAFPLFAIAFNFRLQFFQECFLEFKNFLDVHAGDEGLGSGDGALGEQDVFKLVIAGRKDGGALVDLGGIEQIEHGEVLNGEDAIHALETEATLAIEEV